MLSTRLYTDMFRPRFTEKNPSVKKSTNGPEQVLHNTTGDRVDPDATFIVFKNKAVSRQEPDGSISLRVTTASKNGSEMQVGWVPKDAFESVDDAYYLPTYQFSKSSSLLGGAGRGLAVGGLSGAAAGVAATLVAGKAPDSPGVRALLGSAAGAATLTAFQAAVHGPVGLASAAFVGTLTGAISASAGEGDGSVRDAMLGGTIAGLATTLMTGLPLGVLTASAVTGVAAQVKSPVGRVLVGAVASAAITTAQAALAGTPLPLAAAIGAGMGVVGTLIGEPLGQAARNLQQKVQPLVTKGVRQLLRGRGEKSYQVAAAIPTALTYASLGSVAGLLNPILTPVGVGVGAIVGGVVGFVRAGQRIKFLKSQSKPRNHQGVTP